MDTAGGIKKKAMLSSKKSVCLRIWYTLSGPHNKKQNTKIMLMTLAGKGKGKMAAMASPIRQSRKIIASCIIIAVNVMLSMRKNQESILILQLVHNILAGETGLQKNLRCCYKNLMKTRYFTR